jgi:hypothetical protein
VGSLLVSLGYLVASLSSSLTALYIGLGFSLGQ